MKGYSLKISVRHAPYNAIVVRDVENRRLSLGGIDIEMFYIISKKLNANFKFVGPVTENSKHYKESLEKIFQRGEIDLSLDNELNFGPFSEILFLPKFKDYCVFMPYADKSTKNALESSNPLQGGSYAMLFIIVFFCIFFNWKFVLKFPNNILCYVFFGGAIPEYRKTFIERYITILVVVFFATFNETFLLNLTSLLTLQEGRHQFKTFDEYVESDSPIKLSIYKSFVPTLTEIYPSITRKLQIADNDDSYLSKSQLNETKYAFFTTCAYGQLMEFHTTNFDKETGLKNFYLLKLPLKNVIATYAFRRYSTLRETYGKIWYELFETGVYDKLERFYKSTYELRLHESPVDPLGDFVLSQKNLLTLWVIYFAGITLSFVIFVIEVIYGRATKRRRVESIVFGRKDNSKLTDFTIIIYRYMYDLKLKRYSFSHFRQCDKFKKPRRKTI